MLPTLSFVLASRNDSHGGNSIWRLQTSLNYLALQVAKLGREAEIEAVVTDWGSTVPLREVLQLSDAAIAITRFLEVPKEVTATVQLDSPFPEVLANNAAIRRCRGRFIGRIDQDTLVGERFLSRFLELARKDASQEVGSGTESLCDAFVFIGRRSIPESFTRTSPAFASVVNYLKKYGRHLPREGRMQSPWFDAPVGVLILHRDLWDEYRGYDERMLYWGFMETDLGLRVSMKHRVCDLEQKIGLDLHHLAHSRAWLSTTTRKQNPRRKPTELAPNAANWGLLDQELPLRRAEAGPPSELRETATSEELPHATAVGGTGLPAVLSEWFKQTTLAGGRLARRTFSGDRIS